MRGVAKQRKMAAKLGRAWWDRYGHISTWGHGRPWETWGSDEFGRELKWPKPCADCVEEEGLPVTITD